MASTAEQVRKEAITDIASRQGKTDQKLRFVELRASGHSYAAIAKDLHVSKATLANWNKELETEIASAKAIELEALLEEFYLLKEGRIRLLGGLLQRLREELELERLRVLSLNVMIDLAEEAFKVPIRKKSGAKQQKN